MTRLMGHLEHVDTPHQDVRERARALIRLYVMFILMSCTFIPVAFAVSRERGVEITTTVLVMHLFYAVNIALCRRGAINTSLVFYSVVLGGGAVAADVLNHDLGTSIWLLSGLSAMVMFASQTRQVVLSFLICCGAVLAVALSLLGAGQLAAQPEGEELAHLFILLCSSFLTAYIVQRVQSKSFAHLKMLKQQTSRTMEIERELRQQAEQKREAAEAASRHKDHFLASMSHELRTPLNAILGYAEILCEELDEQPEVPERVLRDADCVRSASRHLLELIQDVLNLADIESGELKMRPERFDVNEPCRQLCLSMRPASEDKGVALRCTVEREPLWVELDPVWVRQVVFNLLSNAVKFTQQGEIELKAEVIGERGELRLSVRDTGIGMSQGEQAEVFEEFVQANAETLREFGGTGLGLALCHKLVARMGGRIELESEPGVGTTVCCVLPTWEPS